MNATLDVYQIAPMIGMARPHKVGDMLRRHGIEPVAKEGRTHLYAIDDLLKVRAWAGILTRKQEEIAQIALRRLRSDRGIPRGIAKAAVDEAVQIAKAYYLSSGMPDVRRACDNAVIELLRRARTGETSVSVVDAEKLAAKAHWFYARWVRRKDEWFRGPFHAEGWQELWKQAYKQHDAALRAPYASRSWWQICESAGWAGEGFGYGRMIALDDRTADVWSVDTDGKPVLAQAIYVWDVLTGALLWIEATPTITTQAYVRAILSTVLVHKLHKCPMVVLENARAAKGVRIDEMIAALYTEQEIAEIRDDRRIKMLFNGQLGPIYRNVPHIAREIGKAMAERSFGVIKREHDAMHNGVAFQGGNRNEAVQMHRSNQPWQLSNVTHARMPLAELQLTNAATYIDSVWAWAWSQYITRQRGSLMHWSKTKRLEPTRAAMIRYYGGVMEMEAIELPPDRWALALFAATPNSQMAVAKVRAPGNMQTRLHGQTQNLVSNALTPAIVGRRVLAVPVPGQTGHWALALEREAGDRRPEAFLGYAMDLTATTVEQAIEHRATAAAVRREIIDAVDAEILESRAVVPMLPVTERHTDLPAHDRQLPGWIGELPAADVSETEAKTTMAAAEPVSDVEYYDEEIERILNL